MKPKHALLVTSLFIVVAYQNFGTLTAEDLRTLETMKEMKTLQESESSQLVVPRKGRDLASVASGWAEDQSRVLLDGADQRLLDRLNQKLQSWVSSEKTLAEESSDEVTEESLVDSEKSLSQNLRFARINSMEYQWNPDSLVTCSIEGDGAHIDFSQKWTRHTSFGIEHKSAENKTQFLFRHNF